MNLNNDSTILLTSYPLFFKGAQGAPKDVTYELTLFCYEIDDIKILEVLKTFLDIFSKNDNQHFFFL